MKPASPPTPLRVPLPTADRRSTPPHGLTLAHLVAQSATFGRPGLSLRRIRRIVADIAPALDALHIRHAAHGYVEPAFILTPRRCPACLVRPGEAPPSATPQEDRRSLAATVYFALTGE